MNIPLLARGHYAVFLNDFRLDARIGVMPEEQVPQPIRIDIAAILSRLGPGDGIEDVVDYSILRDTVREMVEAAHFGLQETLCEGLIERVRRHSGVHGVIVQTRKLRLFPDAEVGCSMTDIDPAALAR